MLRPKRKSPVEYLRHPVRHERRVPTRFGVEGGWVEEKRARRKITSGKHLQENIFRKTMEVYWVRR